MSPALEVRDLEKTFGGGRSLLGVEKPAVHAVQDVTFDVPKGETLGIVGESGCGKSTLARMLVGLLEPSAGSIAIEGRDLSDQTGDPAAFGRLIQYVFQDPLASLNPRKTIRQILEAPLIHLLGLDASARKVRIAELFEAVNLRAEFLTRYPHEFSGGQAQRIGIARALAASPRILVLDEPVSALDVSVQAQVLNLLAELKRALDLTYLFISHDLAVVEAVSDRIAVLYFGRIVEIGTADAVFSAPQHPYTKLLADSAPVVGRPLGRAGDSGELPDPLNPPPGCAFAPRCDRAKSDCRQDVPRCSSNASHAVACFHPLP
ncbi:MAG: ATP-binding cassette domain-containing protein [Alphaproteobacteria bacterium]